MAEFPDPNQALPPNLAALMRRGLPEPQNLGMEQPDFETTVPPGSRWSGGYPMQPNGLPDMSNAPVFGQQGFRAGVPHFLSSAGPDIVAMASGPVGRGFSGLASLLRAAPRASSAAGAATGTVLAADAASPQGGATAPGSLQELQRDRAEAIRKRDEAQANANREAPPGSRRGSQGPNFRRFMEEVARRQTEIDKLDQYIADDRRRSDPAFIAQQNADAEARRIAEETRIANLPLSAHVPGGGAGMFLAGLAGGTGIGALAARRGINTYNTNINALNSNLRAAETRLGGVAPGSPAAVSATTEAANVGDQFRRLESRGPRGASAPVIGGVAGSEVGLSLPPIIDRARSEPGSALRKQAEQTTGSLSEMGARVLGSGVAGLTLGKLASIHQRGRMSEPLGPSGPPPSQPSSLGSFLRRFLPGAPSAGNSSPTAPPSPAGPPPLALPPPGGAATANPGETSTTLSSLLRTPVPGQLPRPAASPIIPQPQRHPSNNQPRVGGDGPNRSRWRAKDDDPSPAD